MTLDGTCLPMFWLNLSLIQIMWKCRFTPAEKAQVGGGGGQGRWGRGKGGQRRARHRAGSAGGGFARRAPLAVAGSPRPHAVRGARSPTGLWPSMAWKRHTSTSGLHTTVSSAGLVAASPGPLSPAAPPPPTSASPMARLSDEPPAGAAGHAPRKRTGPGACSALSTQAQAQRRVGPGARLRRALAARPSNAAGISGNGDLGKGMVAL